MDTNTIITIGIICIPVATYLITTYLEKKNILNHNSVVVISKLLNISEEIIVALNLPQETMIMKIVDLILDAFKAVDGSNKDKETLANEIVDKVFELAKSKNIDLFSDKKDVVCNIVDAIINKK